MDELLEQFLIESRELIASAADDLSALERDPGDAQRIDNAFRAIHTLKGSAAIFDMAPMTSSLHAAEDLLGAARKGEALKSSAVVALITCIDQVDRWVDAVEMIGALPTEASRDAAQLILTLSGASTDMTAGPAAATTPDWAAPLLERERERLPVGEALVAIRYTPDADCFFRGDDPLDLVAKLPQLLAVTVHERTPWPDLATLDPYACNLLIEAVSGATLDEVRAGLRLVLDQVELASVTIAATADQPDAPSAIAAGRSLRVDAARIDALISLIGELSVTKNRIAHIADGIGNDMTPDQIARDLRGEHALLDRLTADLHGAVMRIRTVPLQRIFERLPRLARETAEQLGRQIRFEIAGGSTELDKTIVDALYEPLLHVIRNAIDHGIEPPDRRQAAGKNAEGRIALTARRAGDQAEIEIVDDGAGIDPATMRSLAAARELLTAGEASALDDEAAIALVFRPGFSSAREVTGVSGRGVGMDAVRIAVERLGGQVDIASRVDHGTTVRIVLPLEAVMTTVLVVTVGTERFGVPMDDIVEIVRVPDRHILPIGQGKAFALRDRTVPLVQLADLLGRATATPAGDRRVLIVRCGAERVGVAVDAIASRFSALLRPMGGFLTGLSGMTGTTLLGDGNVLLVLDLPELIG